MLSCKGGELDVVKHLFGEKFILDEENDYRHNGVSLAFKDRHFKVVTFLLEHGAVIKNMKVDKLPDELVRAICWRLMEIECSVQAIEECSKEVDIMVVNLLSDFTFSFQNLRKPILGLNFEYPRLGFMYNLFNSLHGNPEN